MHQATIKSGTSSYPPDMSSPDMSSEDMSGGYELITLFKVALCKSAEGRPDKCAYHGDKAKHRA